MDTTLLRLLLCRSPLVLLLTLATALPMLGGCETPARVAEPAARTPQDAIRRVLNADARLGNVRNDASRSRSVSEAALAYAGALGSLDYSGTPASFRAAFLDHARAWRSFGQTLRGYPEGRHLPHRDARRDRADEGYEHRRGGGDRRGAGGRVGDVGDRRADRP